MNLVTDFAAWLARLPADFAFLLALPFLVGAAGLLADRLRHRKEGRRAERRRHKAKAAPTIHASGLGG